MAQPKDIKRPKFCECGGRLIYSDGPGDYVAVVCDRCTPVVKVPMGKTA